MIYNRDWLAKFAVSNTLGVKTSLKYAISKIKFVQADPIRSPARAQDLILRQRVNNYFAGDLEKRFTELNIVEDYLYAYGFLDPEISILWHPIKPKGLTLFDRKVLSALGNLKEAHPKELAAHVGSKSVRNWWGGKSQAAKHSLDILHWWGLVKVVRREKGIRIYKKSEDYINSKSVEERKAGLILSIVNILAPINERKLSEATGRIKKTLGDTKRTISKMLNTGVIERVKIEGNSYIWPAEKDITAIEDDDVRILAPFDPIVWDRRRFEHLWDWEYRFEAYTPKEKRIRGYYAMPILWHNNIIGWSNISKTKTGLDINMGFAKREPKSKAWKRELGLELDRIKKFLKL